MSKALSVLRGFYAVSKIPNHLKNFNTPSKPEVKPVDFKIGGGKAMSRPTEFELPSPKSSIHKIGLLTKLVLGLSILIPVGIYAHVMEDGKQEVAQIEQSSFETAATKLGFDSVAKQEALLKIFYYAGYLDPHKLWKDLNRIKEIKGHAMQVFKLIYPALYEAHADQREAKQFHPEILRAKLFNGLSEQESADLLLYIAQHAFNRKLGKEVDELIAEDWMTEYRHDYTEAARVLGLNDRIEPSYKEYDAVWIAGSTRFGFLARAIDYFNIISSGVITIKGETWILAGGRELWAEIDGIEPQALAKAMSAAKSNTNMDLVNISFKASDNNLSTEEGKRYILELAQKKNIALHSTMPLIKYSTKLDCPVGREPDRWYPNYALGEKNKLTETLMSQDVLSSLARDKNVHIVDTAATKGGVRPNTTTTAADAAEQIIAQIKAGKYGDQHKFHILLESNQPFVKRQTLLIQAAVNEALKKHSLDKMGYIITVDGIGFINKEEITTVHSEIGALVAEKMKDAINKGKIPKHDLKGLLFNSRNSEEAIPDYLDIPAWHQGHVDLSGEEGARVD